MLSSSKTFIILNKFGADPILDQKKDEMINKLESDLKTLETKNLELKYTNKNLISTLSEQKGMLKALKTKISTLESSKDTLDDYEQLNLKYKKLVDEHKELLIKYNKSLDEISKLKELIPKSKSDNGLIGRFLKRKHLNDNKTVDDAGEEIQKK